MDEHWLRMFEKKVMKSSQILEIKSRWMKWTGQLAHLKEKCIYSLLRKETDGNFQE
jgi:hypothetical protein